MAAYNEGDAVSMEGLTASCWDEVLSTTMDSENRSTGKIGRPRAFKTLGAKMEDFRSKTVVEHHAQLEAGCCGPARWHDS